jgi:hypothetical protein
MKHIVKKVKDDFKYKGFGNEENKILEIRGCDWRRGIEEEKVKTV